jgi:hypothetical protein
VAEGGTPSVKIVSHFILEHLAVPLTFFTTGDVRTSERTTTVLKYKMRNDFDTWRLEKNTT